MSSQSFKSDQSFTRIRSTGQERIVSVSIAFTNSSTSQGSHTTRVQENVVSLFSGTPARFFALYLADHAVSRLAAGSSLLAWQSRSGLSAQEKSQWHTPHRPLCLSSRLRLTSSHNSCAIGTECPHVPVCQARRVLEGRNKEGNTVEGFLVNLTHCYIFQSVFLKCSSKFHCVLWLTQQLASVCAQAALRLLIILPPVCRGTICMWGVCIREINRWRHSCHSDGVTPRRSWLS